MAFENHSCGRNVAISTVKLRADILLTQDVVSMGLHSGVDEHGGETSLHKLWREAPPSRRHHAFPISRNRERQFQSNTNETLRLNSRHVSVEDMEVNKTLWTPIKAEK